MLDTKNKAELAQRKGNTLIKFNRRGTLMRQVKAIKVSE